jgi:hypothetical protein
MDIRSSALRLQEVAAALESHTDVTLQLIRINGRTADRSSLTVQVAGLVPV